jgi:phage gp29-like protein
MTLNMKTKRNNRSSANLAQSPIKQVSKKNTLQVMGSIVPKATSRLRLDVAVWKSALSMAQNPDNQKMYPLHNLYNEIKIDARLTSQIQNRKLKATGSGFVIKTLNGDVDDELTATLSKNSFFNTIISHLWDSITDGHTLLEFDFPTDSYTCTLIPRQNVVPFTGMVLKDYTDDKGILYREAKEYGSWIVEFAKNDDIGLLNKAVPHVIFKRFAQSCWSELCEIYGIPPRVMKTNTADTTALNRAETMMRDMGAAAWFIIDDTENVEFATATSTNGEVYENLIKLCNEEISLLISGVVLGQDSKYGSNSKESSSISVLDDVVNADKRMIEQYMQDKIIPALYLIGFVPSADIVFAWDQAVNIAELWTRTKEILPYKNVDDEWIRTKFGIEITGDRQQAQQLAIQPNDFFF